MSDTPAYPPMPPGPLGFSPRAVTRTHTGTHTLVDVTSTDIYEIGRLWGVEPVPTRNGLVAVPVKEPSFLRTDKGANETGEPGDVLVVHNQKMQRHFMSGTLFEFLFGERL